MTRKNAFTLAEVLITLGIIGVVAAMTMPTLINQTNGAQYKAAYKKALSAIAQGVTLSVALDDISFADTEVASADTANAGSKANTADLLRARMNVVKSETSAHEGFPNGTITASVCTDDDDKVIACTEDDTPTEKTFNPDLYLYFNDSSMFGFNTVDKGCTEANPCYGVIDVNGAKGPNKLVKCEETERDTCTPIVTDIYPVVYYDQTILPASDAARAVLYGK